uniref:Uncharacterized protein n=1 Tax=Glossina brevipalpis TaxID=37001 RepID=A0A1A9WQ03_9MUSC
MCILITVNATVRATPYSVASERSLFMQAFVVKRLDIETITLRIKDFKAQTLSQYNYKCSLECSVIENTANFHISNQVPKNVVVQLL